RVLRPVDRPELAARRAAARAGADGGDDVDEDARRLRRCPTSRREAPRTLACCRRAHPTRRVLRGGRRAGGRRRRRGAPRSAHGVLRAPDDRAQRSSDQAARPAASRSYCGFMSITNVDALAERLLRTYATITVVGASRESGKAAHQIPLRMQELGWRIIPVNPYADELLG